LAKLHLFVAFKIVGFDPVLQLGPLDDWVESFSRTEFNIFETRVKDKFATF